MIRNSLLFLLLVLLVFFVILPTLLGFLGVKRFEFASVGSLFNNGNGLLLRSLDSGVSWRNITEASKGLVVPSGVTEFAFDPVAANRIWVGTKQRGLWKSADLGNTWERVDVAGDNIGIYNIEFGGLNPDVIYLAAFQDGLGKILKSDDGGHSFSEIYAAKNKGDVLTNLVLNGERDQRILISDGRGLLESVDGGSSWSVVEWFDDFPVSLSIEPSSSGILVVTSSGNVYKSIDTGDSWNILEIRAADPGLTSSLIPAPQNLFTNHFRTREEARLVVADPNSFDILYSSRRGEFLRSLNGGVIWTRLKTLVHESNLPSSAVAVMPGDSNRVMVGFSSQIHESVDGGVRWRSRVVPADGRNIKIIFLSPHSADIRFVLTD